MYEHVQDLQQPIVHTNVIHVIYVSIRLQQVLPPIPFGMAGRAVPKENIASRNKIARVISAIIAKNFSVDDATAMRNTRKSGVHIWELEAISDSER